MSVKERAGHAQVDGEVNRLVFAVEAEQQILAATLDAVDAVAAQSPREGARREVADDALGARREAKAGDGAPDDAWRQVAAYGFDFRKLWHAVSGA